MTLPLRPGVSGEYLARSGVRCVTAREAFEATGCSSPGLLIPYFDTLSGGRAIADPGEKSFARLRKATAECGNKYHQPKGTKVHGYLPLGLGDETSVEDLVIIEGEFKAAALMDPAHRYTKPAVGLSGFFGYQLKKEEGEDYALVPELTSALDALRPKRVVFQGDNDTPFNFQFAIAAARLKSLLAHIEVVVPVIPVVVPKGVDDCRQFLEIRFERFYEELLERAVEIRDGVDAEQLAIKLLSEAVPRLKEVASDQRPRWTNKLATLAARLSSGASDEIVRMAKATLGIGKTEFRKSVERERRALAQEAASDRLNQIRTKVQKYFYCGRSFYRQNGDIFTPLAGRDDLQLALKFGDGLSDIEAENGLYLVQKENVVSTVTTIAGQRSGIFEVGGQKILVPRGPSIIEPASAGDASLVVTVLADLVGRQSEEPYYRQQWLTLLGWLQHMVRALQSPDVHQPGQILCLVGPADCGKGFVKEHIFTPIFGGRQADPSSYLLGKSNFNDACVSAEHLCIGDGNIPADPKQRGTFVKELKRVVANESQSMAKKYASQVQVRPVTRITMSLNEIDAGIVSLLVGTSGSSDKVIALKCYRSSCLPNADAGSRKKFLERISQTLPAFIGQLLELEIPVEYRDGRFGIRAFHHPALGGNASAARARTLEEMLDLVVGESRASVALTASQWHQLLRSRFAAAYESLFPSGAHLGRRLSQLTKQEGWRDRVRRAGQERAGEDRNYVPRWEVSP